MISFIGEVGADREGADLGAQKSGEDNSQDWNPYLALTLVDNISALKNGEQVEILMDVENNVKFPSGIPTQRTSKDDQPTPTTSKSRFPSSTRTRLTDKRKSRQDEGPQEKLMRLQVDAVNDQVDTFKRIESILGDIRDIQREKLELMRG